MDCCSGSGDSSQVLISSVVKGSGFKPMGEAKQEEQPKPKEIESFHDDKCGSSGYSFFMMNGFKESPMILIITMTSSVLESKWF